MNAYESLVGWYLRFNGYFTISNFIVHLPSDDSVDIGQSTDADVLAVRFPYAKEVVAGYELALDKPLVDETAIKKVDCIVAEVKFVPEGMVNSVWREPDDCEHASTVQYIVRRFGLEPSEERVTAVADALRREFVVVANEYRIRLIYFSKRGSRAVTAMGIQQITLDQIVEFMSARTGCWLAWKLGHKSRIHQWDPFIVAVWTELIVGGEQEASARIEQLLEKWNESA